MRRRPDHHELAAANARLRNELKQHRCELERLREENEILRQAAEPLIHRAPARERFAFIHRLRGKFSIKRMCRILVTDRSNFYAWVRAQALRDQREHDEQELIELITEIHTAHPAYGAERITRELKRQGVEVGCRRVTRLMREHGIAGITAGDWPTGAQPCGAAAKSRRPSTPRVAATASTRKTDAPPE